MATNSVGTLLTKLLTDLQKFKAYLNGIGDNEFFSNYHVNREWDTLTARHSSLRTNIAMLTPQEKKEFATKYSNERDEVAKLMDELNTLVKNKSHVRKDAEDKAKWAGIATGLVVGALTISRRILKEMAKKT